MVFCVRAIVTRLCGIIVIELHYFKFQGIWFIALAIRYNCCVAAPITDPDNVNPRKSDVLLTEAAFPVRSRPPSAYQSLMDNDVFLVPI